MMHIHDQVKKKKSLKPTRDTVPKQRNISSIKSFKKGT